MHFEGLNIERQAAIAELQAADQRFTEFLMNHIDQPKPAERLRQSGVKRSDPPATTGPQDTIDGEP